MISPIIIEQTLHAPIAKVWKALTDKEEMKKWYFDVSDFKPEKGFEFQFPGQGHKGQQYVHLCRVTEVIPDKKISYTWRYEGLPGDTEVSFELFDEGNKTRIKLSHKGLETFPVDNPDFARESFEGGWNYIIGTSLLNFVENKAA
jgi:uncharacterized protein YndB with AHSA1/START domain